MKKLTVSILIFLLILMSGCKGENNIQVTDSLCDPSSSSVIFEEPDPEPVTVEPEPVKNEPVISYTECDPDPESEYQKSLSFPDRLGEHNNAAFINSVCGFTSYEGQGTLYLSVDENVQTFSLYINAKPVDVERIVAGKTYCLDISPLTVNGDNTVQVSDIFPGDIENAVTVNIPYPVLVPGTPESAGIDPEVFEIIDSIVTNDVEYGFTSAQLSVIKDGKLIYENAWGNLNSYGTDLKRLSDAELKPVNTDTLYDLASNTKMYSANYAVMHLVSNGELSLTDRVCDIIGKRFYEDTVSVKYSGAVQYDLADIREWKKSLTVEDLLCHRAGFPASPKYEIKNYDFSVNKIGDEYENPLFSGNDASFETREKTLESICMTPLMYEPRTKILYSDVDFMLLCFIIEEKTGKRFDEYLNETFYEPMGLTHITYRPLDNGFSKDNIASTELKGNTREGVVSFENIRNHTLTGEVHDEMAYYTMAGISGHAGLFSNATDLAGLAYVMLSGGYGDIKFFSEDVIDTFTSPDSPDSANWGIGWWRNGDDMRPWYFGTVSNNVFGHQGWTGTLTLIDPDNDMVIVYLTNKINSPLVTRKNTSLFEGNTFTSASLGYTTTLIYSAFNTDPSEHDDVYDSLLSDLAAESKRLIEDNRGSGAMSAPVRNYYSKIDLYLDYAEKYDDPDIWNTARRLVEDMDDTRDADAKEAFIARLK